MRTLGALLSICLLVLTVPTRAQTPAWNLSATVAESCSCTDLVPVQFWRLAQSQPLRRQPDDFHRLRPLR